MKKITCFLFLVFSLFSVGVLAQETTNAKKEIDPSNPTNLYTQVNGNFEFQDGKNSDLYGIRVNVQYAFNPDNLMLVELPFLHLRLASAVWKSFCSPQHGRREAQIHPGKSFVTVRLLLDA